MLECHMNQHSRISSHRDGEFIHDPQELVISATVSSFYKPPSIGKILTNFITLNTHALL